MQAVIVERTLRTRPPQAEGVSVARASDALPGFELREAVRSRSFWMISAAQFFFAAVSAGAGLHLITYLTELGYTPSFSAGMMSLVLVFAAVGKLAGSEGSAASAAAVEFVLEGLHLSKRLNKQVHGGVTRYQSKRS